MQARPKDRDKDLNEFDLVEEGKESQPIFISVSFFTDLKQELLGLMRESKDVFTWTYAEMLKLDPQLVTHQLNIIEGSKPVKQDLMNLG